MEGTVCFSFLNFDYNIFCRENFLAGEGLSPPKEYTCLEPGREVEVRGFFVHRDRHLHHLALALLHLGRHLPCDAAVHGAF